VGVEGVEEPEFVLRVGLGRDCVLDQFIQWLRRMREGTRTWSGNIFFCKNRFALARIAVCTRSSELPLAQGKFRVCFAAAS